MTKPVLPLNVRCSEQVWSGSWNPTICRNKAKVVCSDGKPYCGVHDKDKRNREREEKHARNQRIRDRDQLWRDLHDAYKDLGQYVYEKGAIPAKKVLRIQKLRAKLGIDAIVPEPEGT